MTTTKTFNDVIGTFTLNLIGKDFKIQLPQNIAQVVVAVIGILPYIVIIAAIIMVMVGAYHWIKSNGNEKELEKGKETIINALKGIIVLFFFIILSNAISYFLIGVSILEAFFALAPCGEYGTVLDNYNSTRDDLNFRSSTTETRNAQQDAGIQAYYIYCTEINYTFQQNKPSNPQ
ncbi:MAG: hypothetical protein WCK31_02425 [bacterium]